jgi:alkylation response protein AidB-like acyl-CoA dehydrogenase/aminoglycoside phosphotransferase (APT) family kinase protein
VRQGQGFDKTSLENYLKNSVSVFKGPIVEVLQFKGGQSNPTFYFKDSAGREYVLRKKPYGKLLPSAHMVEREYRIINALNKTDVPVPKTYVLCTDNAVIGTAFYVMEYVRGRILRDIMLEECSPEERTAIYKSMADTLAKIHNVDFKAIGLGDYAPTEKYFERQTARWSQQYLSSKTKEIPSMNKLIEYLPKNVPKENEEVTIVHGDYRLDNLIYHPTEPRVLAVLDWELSTLGHPYADLAYNCMPYQLPRFPAKVALNGFGEFDFKKNGIPTQDEYVALYCKLRHKSSIPNLSYYVAFGLFRMSAILQGVYKRALQGNASSADGKAVGSFAEWFADRAWEIVNSTDSLSIDLALFNFSDRVKKVRREVEEFMEQHIYPNEKKIEHEINNRQNRWQVIPLVEELKEKAKQKGLWNLFLPHATHGAPGFSNLEYAIICEVTGRSADIAPEIFNCNAPDTGNMEVLENYGNAEQKKQWLEPLLRGEIRSCFGMTEPAVASSDATNISCEAKREGDEYVINGRKWWITGAGHPNCKIMILMAKTGDKTVARHKQHSMILVPMDTPGVKIVRPLTVFNYDDAPYGHCEISLENVRVPIKNVILGEGRGFEIAQGRLGPGRIHHCMRMIGLAERALEAMVKRIHSRTTFGKKIAHHGKIMHDVATSRIEIDQARLLTLKAAHAMDLFGNKIARAEIAMIKVVAPNMACRVIDRAIQAFGAAGLCEDFPLAKAYAGARTLRLADGPDEVHINTIAKIEYEKQLKKAKL